MSVVGIFSKLKMGEVFAALEAEYCPPLDPPLLSAILSDYDLNDESGVQNARSTLDPLRESAWFQEQTDFDASGTAARDLGLGHDGTAESLHDPSSSLSHDTPLTDKSNALSSVDLNTRTENESETSEGVDDLENLDEAAKIQLLEEVLEKRISRFSIRHTLHKCHGKWHMAMEELLNHVYFNEAEESEDGRKIVAKGVDGFSEDNMPRCGRKSRLKDRAFRSLDEPRSNSLPAPPTVDPVPCPNKWKIADQDVDFIVQRTGLSSKFVRSTYYQSGASVSQAIASLLQNLAWDNSPILLNDDAAVEVNTRELRSEFPVISLAYVRALVRLTHPSTASAHELAKALTAKPPDARKGGLEIIPKYAILSGMDSTDIQDTSSDLPPSSTFNEPHFSNAVGSADRAQAYAAARNVALAQAQAAHRRAKSDRLMGGATAYYGQKSRDYATLSSKAFATNADERAQSQSTADQLDLHGFDVLNGTRVAQGRVEQWWQNLGESRVNGRIGADDRQAGYKIIVGLGKHSESGKSKLGPAVKKMLTSNGWKFEDNGPIIVVKGRVKR